MDMFDKRRLTVEVPHGDYEAFKSFASARNSSVSQAFRESFSKMLEDPMLLGKAAGSALVNPIDREDVTTSLYLRDLRESFKEFSARTRIGTKALSALVLRSAVLEH
jgi:hypothetical protein